jgi:hypothetical protein
LKPVNLFTIVGALGMASDDWHYYLNLESGEVVSVHTDEFVEAEDIGEELAEALDIVRNPDKYIALPDRFDIHEHSIMERFCYEVPDERSQHLLLNAIKGRGAFRSFKETLAILDLREEWYEFRDESFKEIALRWCQAHDIPYVDEPYQYEE